MGLELQYTNTYMGGGCEEGKGRAYDLLHLLQTGLTL